jgi:hypothetical protein
MTYFDQRNQEISDTDVQSIFARDATREMALRAANAHHGVDVIGRLSAHNIGYALENMERTGGETKLLLDRFRQASWSDGAAEQGEFFETLRGHIRGQRDVDGILLSGGIDSLVMTILAPSEVPCYTWDIESGQTAFASYICEKLNRRHIIIKSSSDEGVSKNNSMMDKAIYLRSQFLGHYLPWNSGISGRTEFHNKAFLSGQNADSLLVVDTFAPVFNSYGLRRKVELRRTVDFRKPLNEIFLRRSHTFEQLDRMLNNIIGITLKSTSEHVKILTERLLTENQEPNAEFMKLLKLSKVEKLGDYSFGLKKFKYARFIAPAIEAYKQQEKVYGLKRILPYSSEAMLPHILNYVPAERNLYQPKSVFYEFCAQNGFEFDLEKQKILRKELGRAYLLRRLLNRRQFPHASTALKQMKTEMSVLGVSLNDCLRFLEISEENLLHKQQLMRLDRLLNYMSYTGFRL